MNKCPWQQEYKENDEFNCLTCLRKNLSLMSELGKEDLLKLNQNKLTSFYSKNEYIFKQGTRPTGIYALSGGKIKNLRISDTGNEKIIGIHKPVEFIGFYDFISEQNHSFSAVAIEDCSICFIPKEDFLTVLQGNNDFAVKALKFIGQQYSQDIERITNLTGKHMRGRMADALMYLYDLFNVSQLEGALEIELKRSDFAGLANMNTANAIRTLSEFSKENWIEIQKNRIIFRNISALQHISMTG